MKLISTTFSPTKLVRSVRLLKKSTAERFSQLCQCAEPTVIHLYAGEGEEVSWHRRKYRLWGVHATNAHPRTMDKQRTFVHHAPCFLTHL